MFDEKLMQQVMFYKVKCFMVYMHWVIIFITIQQHVT